MRFITNVNYCEGYKLELTFDNGEVRIADLSSHLEGEIFAPLKNIDYFKTVRVNPDLDTIVWDNDADFAPEFLYEISVLTTADAQV